MRCIGQVATIAFAVACVVLLSVSSAFALPGVKDIKKKAKDKVSQEVDKKAQSAEEAPAEEPGAEPAPEAADPEAKPGEGVWVNYDFVPGDRVLFYDDFSHDTVGNFPQRLELLEGNMEVAEYKGRRWLRATTYGTFAIPLADPLPERFTLEFDFLVPERWNRIYITGSLPEGFSPEGYPTEVEFSPWDLLGGLIKAGPKDGEARTGISESVARSLMHCRVMADGKYMKVYVNELRLANFPNTDFVRSNAIEFRLEASNESPLLMTDLRVAMSDKKMYDALVADGRVVTHGILFDSGSDRIRPESTPTLKEIGQMMKEHPELKLRIEGHTDDVGDDAANQTLSEKRAAAVRTLLASDYGVAADHLEAQGFGETRPSSSNETPEGRQNNRRVELVKI